MANWGTDFWGAYADVARAHMARQLFKNQQAGQAAFGNAIQDPNIFLPQAGPSPNTAGGVAPGGDGSSPAGPVPSGAQGVYQGFIQRGLDPVHAAALAGNWQQESNFNPKAWNPYEGAGGMDQWRGNRLAALKQLAASTGRQWTDPNAQMDYAMQEGRTSEAAPWRQFMAAKNLPEANAALKGFIRYGDNSQGTRLQNAQGILSKFSSMSPQAQQAVQSSAPGVATMGRPGQLAWPHIVQAIIAKNPNISPNALAEAVTLFEPMMNQQSQMDWREQSLALREQGLQQQEILANERIGQQQANEAGRNTRAAEKEQGVQQRFDAKQDAQVRQLNERVDEFRQKMATAQTKAQRDYAQRQMKYLSDRRHQRVMELIAKGNMTNPGDTQKAIDAENAQYQQEQAELSQAQAQATGDQTGATPPAPQSPAAPKGAPPAASAPSPAQQPAAASAPSGGGGVPVLGAFDRWATQHMPGWVGSPMLQGTGGGQPPQGAAPLTLKSPDELRAAAKGGNVPVGSTYNGYRYKGGNVLDPSSWEKM